MTTEIERPASFYLDTDARMAGDPEFRACVMLLMQLADRNGYSPGELKQIAFRAALELELRRPGCSVLTARQIEELEEAAKRRIKPEEMAQLVELVQSGALRE